MAIAVDIHTPKCQTSLSTGTVSSWTHRRSAPSLTISHLFPRNTSTHFDAFMYIQVVDEIYSYCDHVAPWAPGTSRVPSSAFCLLMKLFVMKLTRAQMNEILVHEVCAGLCRY